MYSGWDSNAALLAKFDGEHPPPQEGVAAPSDVVFLVFVSDKRGQSQGFRGLFLNQSECNVIIYEKLYYIIYSIVIGFRQEPITDET